MTHSDLCRLTAQRFVKMFAIYETKIQGLPELPDVITWDGGWSTTVYEIKMSRADFLADFKKKCRQAERQCGDARYFICYGDFIKPEELPISWGLYWYIEGKFILKRKSCDQCWEPYHHPDMVKYDRKAWHLETRILTHQIVCSAAFGLKNIVFNRRYKVKPITQGANGGPPETPRGDQNQAT